jgi:hypothetical protein
MTLVRPGDVGLQLLFDEPTDITLLELSSTFYDFGLLYDWSVLVTIPEYSGYRFGQGFWYRNGRPIFPEHRLYVRSIRQESPIAALLLIPAVAAGAGIPWALLQSIEKIQNWKLNRRKLEAEVEELEARREERLAAAARAVEELEQATARSEIAQLDLAAKHHVEIEERAGEDDAERIERRVIARLEADPLTVADADFFELTDLGEPTDDA